MDAIKDSTSTVAVKVSELGSYSEQIGSIVETIDDTSVVIKTESGALIRMAKMSVVARQM